MEYDLTPEPKTTRKLVPELARQLIGIDTPECLVDLDEKGLIAEDAVCRQCSYNLRGLDTKSRCPECGISIGWSIHGDFLRFSDPAWVKELSSGSMWLIVSIFVGISGSIFDSVLPLAESEAAMGLISSGIGLVGYWKLTTPDPGYPELKPIWNIRQMTRILAVLGFIGLAFILALSLSFVFSNTALMTNVAMSVILTLLDCIAALLLFVLVRRFANRIPDHDLANQTTVVMWGTIASYAVIFIGGVLALLAYITDSANTFGIGVFGVFGCAGMIGTLIFWIWWIVLLFKYRSALNAAVDVAMQSWMRQSSATFYPQ